MLLNRSNQHWRLSHRKTEIQNKERQLKRVKEEDKDPTNKATVDRPLSGEQLIASGEQQRIEKQSAYGRSDERPINEAKQSISDQLDVFNEPTKEADGSGEKQISESEINKQEGGKRTASAYLHLPLDSSQLNNPLSPDVIGDVILPPPSSPVNPQYRSEQRSRNKRYKIERRLNSLTGNKNSSDESDQQINPHGSSDEYEIDSSVNSSAEEDELIDMESTEERTTKLYSKSDFEKLLSDTSEQDSEGQPEVEKAGLSSELESKDILDKQLSNLDAQPAAGANNLLTVQHSHSSDKLKSLDSQSSPNSPTVLSSAASSATLVASPLNKTAPESLLETKDSFDAEDSLRDDEASRPEPPPPLPQQQQQQQHQHVSRSSCRENVKDKNNNISSKPQSSVSFSNQVTKTNYQTNQPPIASGSRTSTPKHAPPQPPQYFLWNKDNKDPQSTNPFASNVDYQPHHKLSTTSTTSAASMSYLRVKSAKAAAAGSADNHGLILDSVHSTPRASFQSDFSAHTTPRSSFQMSESQQMMSSKAGVVVTSSRNSTRRSSSASAASAFAAATAASSKYTLFFSLDLVLPRLFLSKPFLSLSKGNPVEPITSLLSSLNLSGSNYQNISALINACSTSNATSRSSSRLPSIVSNDSKILAAIQQGGGMVNPNQIMAQARLNAKRESVINTAATMRVLNVLRHWISKHYSDFETDPKLMQMTTEFLEELVHNQNLLPGEHKVACQLLQMISKEDGQLGIGSGPQVKKVDLNTLLTPPSEPSKESLDSLTALEIAENMTYLDHKIFIAIHSSEFLCQAWMKNDKAVKAPNILLMTKRFNEMSRLVASEIILANDINKRCAVIEKWTNVADICR